MANWLSPNPFGANPQHNGANVTLFVSFINSAFASKTIGSKVTNSRGFLAAATRAVEAHDFTQGRKSVV